MSRRRRRRKGKLFLLLVAAAVLLMVLLVLQVFNISGIQVVGNRTRTREDIIALSGVKEGDNYLFLNSNEIRENLEQDRYIEYMGRQFDYSGTMTLRVNERSGMGTVKHLGLYYVIDDDGMVLECTGSELPSRVSGPDVTGFDLQENSRMVIGEKLAVRDKEQLTDMGMILRALEKTNMLGRTVGMDLSNLDNLYITTAEGARVVLGNAQDLILKLSIAREVLALREEEGKLRGAKIDVSSGKDAHYIPSILPTPTPEPTATPTIVPEETPKRK